MKYVIIYLLIMNFLAFVLYAVDKQKARKGKYRIPEKQLLFVAFAGGSVGAYAAMKIFHHKTQKPKFSIGVVVFIILDAIAVYLLATKIL